MENNFVGRETILSFEIYFRWSRNIFDDLENYVQKIYKKNSRPSGKFSLEKKFSIDKKILDRQKLILDLPNNSQQVKKIV